MVEVELMVVREVTVAVIGAVTVVVEVEVMVAGAVTVVVRKATVVVEVL